MNEDWTGVIFGMGVLILGTVILVVVLVIVGRFVTERAQRPGLRRARLAAEQDREQQHARHGGGGQYAVEQDRHQEFGRRHGKSQIPNPRPQIPK